MGAFASGLADAASKFIAPVLEHTGQLLEKSASIEHVLNKYPESRAFVEGYHNDFVPAKNQYVSTTLKDAFEKHRPDITQRVDITKHPDYNPTIHKAPDKIVNGVNQPGAPLKVGRIHPTTGKILSDAPIETGKIETEGTRLAREQWLGKGDVAGVFAAHKIELKYGLAAAESFSDTMAFLLKDNETKWLKQGTYDKQRIPVQLSTFKQNARQGGVNLRNTSPTFFPKTKTEKAVTSYIYKAFSPLLAIPHTATFFNGMFGTDPGTFLKGAFTALSDGLGKNSNHWQALVDTGAMTESLMRETANYNRYVSTNRAADNSIIPTLSKFFLQPGFSYLRDMTLVQGGLTGQYTAEQVARDFVQNPKNMKLQWQMREFDLDPKKILRQGGKLDKEDMNKAVFKFVDKHYFLDNTLQRSRLLQSTPTGRMLGMYHGYVTRQSKFMYRAMFRDAMKQGMGATAKNIAIGALLFPMIGEGIKTTEEAIRGQNAISDLQDDISNIEGDNGASGVLKTYFQAMAHVGAFGVWSNMIRGSLTHSLATTFAGPVGKAVADLGQDTGSAVKKTWDNGTDNDLESVQNNFAPLERDFTYDIPGVSLLANLLDHRFLPKKNEDPDNDPVKELYDSLGKDDVDKDKNKDSIDFSK